MPVRAAWPLPPLGPGIAGQMIEIVCADASLRLRVRSKVNACWRRINGAEGMYDGPRPRNPGSQFLLTFRDTLQRGEC